MTRPQDAHHPSAGRCGRANLHRREGCVRRPGSRLRQSHQRSRGHQAHSPLSSARYRGSGLTLDLLASLLEYLGTVGGNPVVPLTGLLVPAILGGETATDLDAVATWPSQDRKSTRLNSSHVAI